MQVHFVWCSEQRQRQADHSVTGVLPALCVCLIAYDPEISTVGRPRPELGCCATKTFDIKYESETWSLDSRRMTYIESLARAEENLWVYLKGRRCGPGWLSGYSDSLRAGRSGDRITVKTFSAPVHTNPGAHPEFCTMGNGSLSRG